MMMFSHAAKHFLPITSPSSSASCSSINHHYHSSSNYTMNGQRKRQRRQTAGALVSNLLGGGAHNAAAAGLKKSTAQPRPQIQVPPRGIGPIQEPNVNDVLCGRGGRINSHAGNVQFRTVVADRKADYLAKTTKKLEKAHIAAQVVQSIRNMEPGGRFLKEDLDGDWYDIGDSKAIKKVGQALREDAADIRTGGSGSGGDDEDDNDKDNDNSKDENQGSKTNKSDPQKPAAKPTNPAATTVPTLHQSSAEVVPPKQPGMTVSGRGAKAVTVPVARHHNHQHHQQEHQHQQHHQQHGQQHPQQPKQSAYQPLAYQPVMPPPMYAQVVPSQTPSHNENTGTFYQHRMPLSAPAFSGAAAAALSEPDNAQEQHGMFEVPPTRDVAFDRTFYPPPPVGGEHWTEDRSQISALEHWTEDRSQISALSGPSTMLSGLSDPISSLSAGEAGQRRSGGYAQQQQQAQHQQSRITQLAAIRQQWAAHQHQQREISSGSNPISDVSALKNSGSTGLASAGLGSSLHRSLSFPDVLQNLQTGSIREDMSWTDMNSLVGENSLVGGGIGGSLLSGTASFNMGGGTPGHSLLSGASSYYNAAVPMREEISGDQRAASGSSRASARNNSNSSSSRSTNRMGTNLGAAQPRERGMSNMSASIASMSMHSGVDSLTSIPGSIMSDLSEGLIALDLAEPRMLDR